MTERRRPLDNPDGQESLFGGEAFALTPGAPVSWQRPAPERDDADAPREVEAQARAFDTRVSEPLDGAPAGAFETRVSESLDGAPAGAFEAGVRAPLDDARSGAFETQAEDEYLGGPSAEDLAAYAALEGGSDAQLLAGSVPTEVPAHGAGVELEALERATVVADDVGRSRAPLAGPTLDDMMSRVWEGLAMGMPAACPVCHGEVVASFAGSVQGSCSSCGTMIQ